MFTISSSRRSSSNLPIASNCPSFLQSYSISLFCWLPVLFWRLLLLVLPVWPLIPSFLPPVAHCMHLCFVCLACVRACILNSLPHVFVVLFLSSGWSLPLCSFCLFRLHISVGLLVCFFFVLAMFRYYVDFVYFFFGVYLSATTKAHFWFSVLRPVSGSSIRHSLHICRLQNFKFDVCSKRGRAEGVGRCISFSKNPFNNDASGQI